MAVQSTLLSALTRARGGFYWAATRAEAAIHLERLGDALGEHLGVGSLALADWEELWAGSCGWPPQIPLRSSWMKVNDDVPRDLDDFSRWVAERVLSPAATLHHEAATLLAEDPALASASPTLYHGILGVIANRAVTAGKIANQLRRQVSPLSTIGA